MEPNQVHPLHRTWVFYLHYPLYTSTTEQYGSAAYHGLCTFKTVEEFWQNYNHIPPPSMVFANDSRPRVKLGGRIIEGFGMFKKDIQPEWEKTPNGGHWEISGITDPTKINQIWEMSCLMIVGESISQSLHVIGSRVVDKSKARKPLYRVEIWLSTQDQDIRDEIIQNIIQTLESDGYESDNLICTWKKHPLGYEPTFHQSGDSEIRRTMSI